MTEQRPRSDEDTGSVWCHEAGIDIDSSTMDGTENVLRFERGNQREGTNKGGKMNKPTNEDRLLGLLERKAAEDLEDDKFFLLFVLPSFKKMDCAQI